MARPRGQSYRPSSIPLRQYRLAGERVSRDAVAAAEQTPRYASVGSKTRSAGGTLGYSARVRTGSTGQGEAGRGMATAFARGIRFVAMGACALAVGGMLAGCSLLVPPISQLERGAAQQVVDDSALVAPGVLTVAMDFTDAPQAITAQDGSLTGYYVDYGRALAERMGLDVRFVSSASPRCIDEGIADVFLGLRSGTDSGSDFKNTHAVATVCQDASALFAKDSSNDAVASTSDLEGSTIAMQGGSASQDTVERLRVSVTPQTFSNVNDCFEALEKGEVQYVLCDATSGGYLSRAYDGVRFVGSVGEPFMFSAAVSAQNRDLAQAVERVAGELESNGTLDALYTCWYGDAPFDLSQTLLDGVSLDASSQDEEESEESDSTLASDINSLG